MVVLWFFRFLYIYHLDIVNLLDFHMPVNHCKNLIVYVIISENGYFYDSQWDSSPR